MDIRRTVILIGLAISSYFLILAWNEDYGSEKQIDKPIANETRSSGNAEAPAVASDSADNAELPHIEVSSVEDTGVTGGEPSGELIG